MSCRVNSSTITSSYVKWGWKNTPQMSTGFATPLAFPIEAGSSQSYLIDLAPSLLAYPPLLNFLLQLCPVDQPPPPHIDICAASAFLEKSSTISTVVPIALHPSLPAHGFLVGILSSLRSHYRHFCQGCFINARSTLWWNCCPSK